MLHSVFEWAVKDRLIPRNPTEDCIAPKVQKIEMQILPPEHIKDYLDTADKRGLLPMFYLELVTGLRKGEITALLWSDLDARNNTISVSKQSVKNPNGELNSVDVKTVLAAQLKEYLIKTFFLCILVILQSSLSSRVIIQEGCDLAAVDGGVGVRTVGNALVLDPILCLFVPDAAASQVRVILPCEDRPKLRPGGGVVGRVDRVAYESIPESRLRICCNSLLCYRNKCDYSFRCLSSLRNT